MIINVTSLMSRSSKDGLDTRFSVQEQIVGLIIRIKMCILPYVTRIFLYRIVYVEVGFWLGWSQIRFYNSKSRCWTSLDVRGWVKDKPSSTKKQGFPHLLKSKPNTWPWAGGQTATITSRNPEKLIYNWCMHACIWRYVEE